jgi:uncharacterized membrane protein YccC
VFVAACVAGYVTETGALRQHTLGRLILSFLIIVCAIFHMLQQLVARTVQISSRLVGREEMVIAASGEVAGDGARVQETFPEKVDE